MDNILISLNREQADNLDMLLEQGIRELPDDAEELALSFGIQNGAAAAKTLTVDYIGAYKERTAVTEL